MREILSNDNNDYSKHILSDKTSLSTSNTPPLQSMLSLFEPCGRSNSTSSMPSISVTSFQQKHKQQQQQQQEGGEGGKFNQPQYSLDHSSGTSTSTNAYSQSSSLSPSVEQV
uniref:Uncharacterized protein n=1 Tax=Wuchereria bancrofti TaxID=6293 RepID=A0A1I8ENA8_WUCBA